MPGALVLATALVVAGLVWGRRAPVAPTASPEAQTTPAPTPNHHAAVNERGDHVMGFDHEKTTHHFRLTKSGGVSPLAMKKTGHGKSDLTNGCGSWASTLPGRTSGRR